MAGKAVVLPRHLLARAWLYFSTRSCTCLFNKLWRKKGLLVLALAYLGLFRIFNSVFFLVELNHLSCCSLKEGKAGESMGRRPTLLRDVLFFFPQITTTTQQWRHGPALSYVAGDAWALSVTEGAPRCLPRLMGTSPLAAVAVFV